MQELRSAPYSLSLGTLVVAVIEAKNIVGFNWSPSAENTGFARVRTEPLAPLVPVLRVDSETTDTHITVAFANFYSDAETGGAPLLSLNLWFDQGTDNWVSVQGEYPWYSLRETRTVGLPGGLLVPGRDYKFKYRGINLFGIGAFSSDVTVTAATKPDQVSTPAQLIVNRDLRVTWNAPNMRGSPITGY
jgi:hypothetical protein